MMDWIELLARTDPVNHLPPSGGTRQAYKQSNLLSLRFNSLIPFNDPFFFLEFARRL